MARSNFQQKFSEFLSYAAFFGFVALVGFAGFWGYRVYEQKTASAAAATATTGTDANDSSTTQSPNGNGSTTSLPVIQKPSDLLKPLMEKNLPPLLLPLAPEAPVLSADFQSTETSIKSHASQAGSWQPAWVLATHICGEIRAGYALRLKTANDNQSTPVLTTSGSTKISQVEVEENKKRVEFFQRIAANRWQTSVEQIHTRIELLYRQLLAAEAKAGTAPTAVTTPPIPSA